MSINSINGRIEPKDYCPNTPDDSVLDLEGLLSYLRKCRLENSDMGKKLSRLIAKNVESYMNIRYLKLSYKDALMFSERLAGNTSNIGKVLYKEAQYVLNANENANGAVNTLLNEMYQKGFYLTKPANQKDNDITQVYFAAVNDKKFEISWNKDTRSVTVTKMEDEATPPVAKVKKRIRDNENVDIDFVRRITGRSLRASNNIGNFRIRAEEDNFTVVFRA